MVLDADAISVFEETRELLFDSIQSPCLMTPHEGEFSACSIMTRLRYRGSANSCALRFDNIDEGQSTVITAPNGKVAINVNAPLNLATAGAGDVLAGFAIGLLAHSLDPLKRLAWRLGFMERRRAPSAHGLIAEDLPDALPGVLNKLREMKED